jgi:DNA/RNA-binding domain of Phe-tRNA-synthetase-like protein
VSAEGRPVLCDREGPFGGPAGDALRTRVTPLTRRALVVLYLSPKLERSAVDRLMNLVAAEVTQRCGGREAARLIVG